MEAGFCNRAGIRQHTHTHLFVEIGSHIARISPTRRTGTRRHRNIDQMAEILDIITSCITLGQVCMQTATNIYALFSKANAVDGTLSELVNHVDSLAGVLKSIAETYSSSEDHWKGRPFVQHHWENVQKSMGHCKRTMDTLDTLVKSITIEPAPLGWRLRLSNGRQNAKAKIIAYKDVIEAFCRSMQISLQLIDLYISEVAGKKLTNRESNAQNHRNINTTITLVEGNVLNRLVGIEGDVKLLLEFIQSGITKVVEVTSESDEIDPLAKSELVIFIEDGIKSSVDSAQSVVDEIRSSHSKTEVSLPSPESDSEEESDQFEPLNSPATETHTIPSSILEAIGSDDHNEGINMDVLIIEEFREGAKKKFKEKNYAEAEEYLQEVRRLSEKHCGNLYEWKDETTMLRVRTLCFMHRWNEVEEIMMEEFKGKDDVLCELAKEYCIQGQTHDAFRLLKRHKHFQGRDETIATIVEDLRLEKKWEAAAKFADVEFVGKERPLEMVAMGCQHDRLWLQASILWLKVLHCKIARQASTADTFHAIANSYLHLQNTSAAADWCKEAIQQRLNSVGKDHLLFHHSVNLLARIHLADGNHGDAMAKRKLLGVHFNGNLPDIAYLS
jgi:hypothetical protein